MDTLQVLLLIPLMIPTSQCSVPRCHSFYQGDVFLLEGEALYFMHNSFLPLNESQDEELLWYRETSQPESLTTDETERIHYHARTLFLLNISLEDSGNYKAWQRTPSGECFNYHVNFNVSPASYKYNESNVYGIIESADQNVELECPDPVTDTCNTQKGVLTWYRNFSLLLGQQEASLWVNNASKQDDGMYTCICTWVHNEHVYNTSGSWLLKRSDPLVHRDIMILSPTNKEQYADEGAKMELNCTVFCGTNVQHQCDAIWHINGHVSNMADGYDQTLRHDSTSSDSTIITAVLSIEKVSAKDFLTEFECIGKGNVERKSVFITLKPRETAIPLVIGGVCLLFLCVFVAFIVKFFAIDLALLFRPCIPFSSSKDAKTYDAYVVYQMQSRDKTAEDTLSRFITNVLPSVLEKKCGYRLFIQGRDDIPGEDYLELVEDHVRQSRMLMVILTPDVGSEATDEHCNTLQNTVDGGFDWQVGLHHALVQREMNIILIQLGDIGPHGYSYLPTGLQHLIEKSAPIRWPESSKSAAAWNSRFWKRIRYLMPARPVSKSAQSALI